MLQPHLLTPIKRRINRPNQNQLITQLEYGKKFLLLHLAQIPIDPIIPEMFCIFFDFTHDIHVGGGGFFGSFWLS